MGGTLHVVRPDRLGGKLLLRQGARRGLVLVAATAAAAAMSVAVGPAAEAAPITFVKGTVTAADTQAPMAGVKVLVFQAQDQYSTDHDPISQTQTDSGGKYSFRVTAGTYDVSFEPSLPYVSNQVQFVTPTSPLATLNDAVQLGATVVGTVTDASTGQPISGLCVYADHGSCTDERGNYEIDNVRPGKFHSVTANYGSATSNPDYDSATQVVALDPGQTSVVDFALTPKGRVQLTVLSANGQPLQGVSVLPGTFGSPGGPVTDASGAVLLRLDPGSDGTRVLAFTPPESDSTDAGTTARVSVIRGQTTSYTVTLPQVAVLTVHVVHPDGSTHEGDCLNSAGNDPDQYEAVTGFCTDSSDTMTLRLSPGSYTYNLSNSSDARDEAPFVHGTFTVTSGVNDLTIAVPRLVLGSVTGVVTDQATGLPLSGVTVTAEGISTTTGTDGRYTLTQLGHDGNDVFVLAQPNDAIHAQQGAVVSIVPGGTVTLDFALQLTSV